MATSRRICVDWVRYGDGNVYVRAHVQVVDNTNTVLADLDSITLEWLERDVIAKAIANGRSEWGNTDIEQLLLESEIPDGVTVVVSAGRAALPAVVDPATGEVLRAALPATDPVVRTSGLRFDGTTAVVWTQTQAA